MRKVYRTWGTSRTKALIWKILVTTRKLRADLKVKYDNKVQHLQRKFKEKKEEESFKLPPNLQKYKDIDCFQPGFKTAPATDTSDKSPLVYGGLVLDEDEIAAVMLDPKFMTNDTLSLDDFEVEVESCLAKLRWNKIRGRTERRRT